MKLSGWWGGASALEFHQLWKSASWKSASQNDNQKERDFTKADWRWRKRKADFKEKEKQSQFEKKVNLWGRADQERQTRKKQITRTKKRFSIERTENYRKWDEKTHLKLYIIMSKKCRLWIRSKRWETKGKRKSDRAQTSDVFWRSAPVLFKWLSFLFLLLFCSNSTRVWRTDESTDGQTHSFIEMRERIQEYARGTYCNEEEEQLVKGIRDRL